MSDQTEPDVVAILTSELQRIQRDLGELNVQEKLLRKLLDLIELEVFSLRRRQVGVNSSTSDPVIQRVDVTYAERTPEVEPTGLSQP